MNAKKVLISIIVPVKNEQRNVRELYKHTRQVFKNMADYAYEFVYVDDGSTDSSVAAVEELEAEDKSVRLIRLARNFGKEIATSAGLRHAQGDAAIMIDADLQHPPSVIPNFLKKWEEGYDVVIGVRDASEKHDNFVKLTTSRWFYRFLNTISAVEIMPNATDFRLLDRTVVNEFNRFTEHNRMTRGLVDWLGFSRTYVKFVPAKRRYGEATYGYAALLRLALNSIIGMSFFPLRLAGYLGIVIVLISAPLGVFILIERFVLHDPMHLHFTGPSILATFNSFLIGIVLMCLGLIALYIANIHSEVANRPLYVEKRRPRQKGVE